MNRHILDEFARRHADALKPVTRWIGIVESVNWVSGLDILQYFPYTDDVGNRHFVFNIKGNRYRMVAIVIFIGAGIVNIRWAGKHEEYNRIPDCSVL